MKPVELCARAIRNSSKRGEIVLDPFGGSGSTLVACQKIGHNTAMPSWRDLSNIPEQLRRKLAAISPSRKSEETQNTHAVTQ